MTAEKYFVFQANFPAGNLWSVVRSVPYISDTPAGFSNSHIGHATTLSGAVTLAQEHAGRELAFKWDDDFTGGVGQ